MPKSSSRVECQYRNLETQLSMHLHQLLNMMSAECESVLQCFPYNWPPEWSKGDCWGIGSASGGMNLLSWFGYMVGFLLQVVQFNSIQFTIQFPKCLSKHSSNQIKAPNWIKLNYWEPWTYCSCREPSLSWYQYPTAIPIVVRSSVRSPQRLYPMWGIWPRELSVRILPGDGVYSITSRSTDGVLSSTFLRSSTAGRIRGSEKSPHTIPGLRLLLTKSRIGRFLQSCLRTSRIYRRLSWTLFATKGRHTLQSCNRQGVKLNWSVSLEFHIPLHAWMLFSRPGRGLTRSPLQSWREI